MLVLSTNQGCFEQSKGESLNDSLRNLSRVRAFFWPGAGISPSPVAGLPLHKTVGSWDADAVLSNRRFLKLLEELRRLPKEEAAKKVSECIRESLAQYKQAAAKYEAEHESLFRPDMEPRVGCVFQISDRPDGPPTLVGRRFAILALVLLAGNLELNDSYPAVCEVVKEACAQRRHFSDPNCVNKRAGFSMLARGALYNRQILTTGLLGTVGKAKAFPAPVGSRRVIRKLTAFNAGVTPYESFLMSAPPDYSRGTFDVSYLDMIDDPGFDLVVRETPGGISGN
jgi:hypothetical protein